MKIAIKDEDGHNFPNLALMKLSSYHKNKGDSVEFIYHFNNYDICYVSKIFTFSPDDLTVINADKIIKGGTGYDLKNTLPYDIEHQYPDYSLYPQYAFAMGFLTRGCPRGCGFCIVKEKEGDTHLVAEIGEFWKGQKEIAILDSNILAYKDRENLLEQLAKTKSNINFFSGLDIRLMTKDIANLVKKMKIKRVHIAYDNIKDKEIIEKNITEFMSITGFKRHKLTCYVLVNYNTTFEEDVYRVNTLKKMGVSPYVMIYNKHLVKRGSDYLKLQRWCNSPRIIWTCNWEDYNRRK